MDIDLEGNQQWLEKILRLIVAGQEEKVNLSCENWVPRFWANNTDDDASITVVMVLLAGVCFGVIHCIAWVFTFPTHTAVDLANIQCHYHNSPHLQLFDVISG